MPIWMTTNGKIAKKEDTGEIWTCDTCPCSGCGALRTSYTILGFHGPFVLPAIPDPPDNVCYDFLTAAGAREVGVCQYATCSTTTDDIVGLSRQSTGSGTWYLHTKTSFGWAFFTPSASGPATADPTSVTWAGGSYTCV